MVTTHCITATKAFQLLIQSTADVTDHRDDGEKIGIIKQWMSDDEAIAIVLALRVITEYEINFSPKVTMSLLINYCRTDLIDAYADFVIQLFKKENVVITLDELKNKQHDVLIDVENFAIACRRLNFKPSWNPFREPFSTQWRNGFMP